MNSKKTVLLLIAMFSSILYGQIVENEDRPLRGTWDYELKKIWALEAVTDDVSLIDVVTILVDEGSNSIYLFDRKLFRVFILDGDGRLKTQFGRMGEGPGEFMDAARYFDMTHLDDRVLIREVNTLRVHFFSKNGKFIRTKKIIKRSYGHAFRQFINADLFLYVISGEKENDSIIGIYNMKTDTPGDILKISPEQDLTVTSKSSGNVSVKSPSLIPSIVACADDKRIFFGKNDRYKISVVDFTGKTGKTFLIKGRKQKKISAADKEKRFADSGLAADLVDKLVKDLPDTTTYFDDISIGPGGLLYVRNSSFARKDYLEYDIFSASGVYLYNSRMQLPRGYTVKSNLAFTGENLYVFLEDRDGERQLFKFSISTPESR